MSTLPLRQRLLMLASREVGILEVPKNSNTGKRVREYQAATNLSGTGWPWCAAFVCWLIREWGQDPEVLEALGLKNAAAFEKWRPKTAAAYGFDEWAERLGLKVFNENKHPGEVELRMGDIVTFDFSHVAIIESTSEAGKLLHTIEGNTDEAGSREGGGVYAKRRRRGLARTIIRILE